MVSARRNSNDTAYANRRTARINIASQRASDDAIYLGAILTCTFSSSVIHTKYMRRWRLSPIQNYRDRK